MSGIELSDERIRAIEVVRMAFLAVLEERVKGLNALAHHCVENRSFYVDRSQTWVSIHDRVRVGMKIARDSEAGDLFAVVCRQMGVVGDYEVISSFFLS